MSLLGAKRGAIVRKPSPPRDDSAVEQTFQQKLDEIKRMRMVPKADEPPPNPPLPPDLVTGVGGVVPQKVLTVTGYKTFLKSFGDWVEVVSKSGKVYFYNKRTLVNQWKKPEEWLKEEERLNAPPPPLPPDLPNQPPLPDDKLKLKLKMKTKKKVKKRVKTVDSHLPLAYQKNGKRLDSSSDEDEKKPKLTIDNAFDDPDAADEEQKLAKLDPQDEMGHLKPEPVIEEPKTDTNLSDTLNPANENDETKAEEVPKKDPKDCRKFDPRISGPERAENLVDGCAAALAFKNISSLPEATALYGENSAPQPASITGNPTYFTEYNLPCCLRRCKFPKEQDVLHELKINKLKRRTFLPPPLLDGLDPKLAHLARDAQQEQFLIEVKNYNNHDRLMTSRMSEVLVYKIPDDVWDRYFNLFQIKLFDGIFLECKPSGYTHNDELIYSRTGKICGHKTFPEDEARCQAVLQAWGKDYCLCMYANRVFKIKRDDESWEDDLYECKRFLERRGF